MTATDDETLFAANPDNSLYDNFPDPGLTPDPPKSEDAPYGVKADGTPRRKPGPQKGTRVGAAARPPGSPRIPGGRKPASTRRSAAPDYRPGILGILQIPAFALGAAGQLNPALALDGAAIGLYAPNIAEALNDLAAENPAVAAALDRILSAGPYGAIIGACLPLAFQIAANHKAIPDAMARSVGAMPAEDFKSTLVSQHKRPGS